MLNECEDAFTLFVNGLLRKGLGNTAFNGLRGAA